MIQERIVSRWKIARELPFNVHIIESNLFESMGIAKSGVVLIKNRIEFSLMYEFPMGKDKRNEILTRFNSN